LNDSFSKEDAHWFLQILLQHLEEEIVFPPVSQLFETKKASEFNCSSCLFSMRDQETKLMIQTLGFPQTMTNEDMKSCTLDDCLSMWNIEKSFECTMCQMPFSQKVTITQLPKILCFHFNRSRWTGKVIQRATRSGAKGKISTKIIFPIFLDMTSFQKQKEEKAMYGLAAVIVHDGLTPATGHYYTLAFNIMQKKWYKFDDANKPKEVSENTVLKSNPFMLFYQQL